MAPPAEISIPSTILSTGESKPFTLYNITLRLPLRSFVVQKRYSDFASLHSSLTTHVGSPPPAPLPQKSWFKSTVSSPELTENRRRGLEHYLRTIAESPDRRWRDTPAWRAFLNLPSGGSAAGTRELDNEGVLQLQKQMMGEQDQQVEALGAIIRRQKEMGLQINEEIEATTDMLDRMNEDVDRVGGKVRVAKNRIKKL
ncbi:Putative sterigmatocystin biosynthesis [Verticillium dahliae VDG2]|nr:Putative sterigmatocystin biosynthesis [Verticillium dahliae VDG2]